MSIVAPASRRLLAIAVAFEFVAAALSRDFRDGAGTP